MIRGRFSAYFYAKADQLGWRRWEERLELDTGTICAIQSPLDRRTLAPRLRRWRTRGYVTSQPKSTWHCVTFGKERGMISFRNFALCSEFSSDIRGCSWYCHAWIPSWKRENIRIVSLYDVALCWIFWGSTTLPTTIYHNADRYKSICWRLFQNHPPK